MSFLFRRNTAAKPSPSSDCSELAELILVLKKYSKSSRQRELPPHLLPLLQLLDEQIAQSKHAPQSRALVPQPALETVAPYTGSGENLRAIAHHRRRFTLDKIVFLCSCAYLLGVAGWVYQTRVSSLEQVVQGNVHRPIISYMGRSLQAIEPPQPPQPAPTPQKTLPVPPVKPLPTITAVPVTSLSTPAPPPVPPQPAAAPPKAPSTPVLSTPNLPPAAPAPAPTPAAASPKDPSTPVLAAKAPVPPPPAIQTPAYRLVGLVELGDRSVALININNVTQRVAIGETIGSSGWTLEAVTAQSVALNRNGEKRSLYVGQDF